MESKKSKSNYENSKKKGNAQNKSNHDAQSSVPPKDER